MDVCVTGLGHVSNVGLTAEGTCAAHRAGISRAAMLDGVLTYDPDEMATPVLGAPVQGVTEGFFQASRWVRLALAALDDLTRYASVDAQAEFWEQAAVLWVVPDIEFARFRVPEDRCDEFLDVCCKQVLLAVAQRPIAAANLTIVPGGSARVAAACLHAETLLSSNSVARVVILATDSWLDPLSINTLVDERRLKDAENPAGLLPGEAGVAFMLETEGGVASRGATPEANVLAIGLARAEPSEEEVDRAEWRSASIHRIGDAVAHAVRVAVGAAAPFRGDVVVDINGEPWKSNVWGYALTRLADTLELDSLNMIVPAESFGDIGAASAAASMSLAVRSFVRRYASTSRTLIVTLSDGGEASAMLVETGAQNASTP